jgi:SAM-dependent methyltransferase
VAGDGSGVGSLGADARELARRGHGARARPCRGRRGRACPRRGGGSRRPDDRGSVLATDISSSILEHLARGARTAGLSNVSTRTMDGENLEVEDESFDAVVSRVGLIYFPDRQRALGEMRRALREGGRVASIVYSTAERNAFFSIPVAVIRRVAGLVAPAPGMPGPFSLGRPGALADAYQSVGLRGTEVETVEAPLRFATTADCVRFEQESFGALHAMLGGVSEKAREEAWAEIEEELGQFEGPDGFVGPCELIVGAAAREVSAPPTAEKTVHTQDQEPLRQEMGVFGCSVHPWVCNADIGCGAKDAPLRHCPGTSHEEAAPGTGTFRGAVASRMPTRLPSSVLPDA